MRSLAPRPSDLVPLPETWGGGRSIATAAADLVLALDAKGLIRDLLLPDRALARDLTGYTGWIGTRWDAWVTAESRAEIEAMLRQAQSDPAVPLPAFPWRLVEHVSRRRESVPLLCTILPPSSPDSPLIALGRDLLQFDLAGLALRADASVVRAYARAALSRSGASPEALCLDMFAPAARRIGDLWTDDRCDALAVTEATWRLRTALEELPGERPDRLDPSDPAPRRRALLSLAPGEEHGLGLAMLERFLRWSGWEVTVATPAEVATLLRAERFDLLGVSAGTAERLPELAAAIRGWRRASRHRGLKVMVGGWAVTAHPERTGDLGADAIATDARQAVLVAGMLVPAPTG